MCVGVKGVVLCGGRGKRLRPLTYYFQKTMIPIGSRQKPLLEYIVKLFRYYGFRDLIMLVGYKHEQVVNYFEDGSRFGVRISYLEDSPDLVGSGHALLNAYEKGFFNDVDDIIVYYGDILTNIDLNDLYTHHIEKNADATLAVATKYQVPVGIVKLDDDHVSEMVEKPWLNMYVTIGILALSKRSLDILKDLKNHYIELDIMSHYIPELLNKKLYVTIYSFDGFWYDVGTTERYEKLDNSLIEKSFKEII